MSNSGNLPDLKLVLAKQKRAYEKTLREAGFSRQAAKVEANTNHLRRRMGGEGVPTPQVRDLLSERDAAELLGLPQKRVSELRRDPSSGIPWMLRKRADGAPFIMYSRRSLLAWAKGYVVKVMDECGIEVGAND